MAQTQFKSICPLTVGRCWRTFSPQATLSSHPATVAALLRFPLFRFAGWF